MKYNSGSLTHKPTTFIIFKVSKRSKSSMIRKKFFDIIHNPIELYEEEDEKNLSDSCEEKSHALFASFILIFLSPLAFISYCAMCK